MTLQTNSQKMAQTAYRCICERQPNEEFRSFVRGFPSLIHSCGLAQAVAFAYAKQRCEYLQDLTKVLQAGGYAELSDLAKATREDSVTKYIRVSRHALQAAGWLKRYVEAVEEA